MFDEIIILSAEDANLAELLGELKHGDFGHLINELSESARDEIRSAVGVLIASASRYDEPPEESK